MRALLFSFSWRELKHHPWRNAAAVAAVMLGVALAFSVQLINASALSEFSQAVRAVNGQPDLELRAVQGGFDESLYQRMAADPRVALASPVLEVSTYAVTQTAAGKTERLPLRIMGVDVLAVGSMAPALMPVPASNADRFALFAPGTVFLNPAAQQLFGGSSLRLQSGLELRGVSVAGTVGAGGGPLAVMDIAAAQDLFGKGGQLSRIDVRLKPGTETQGFIASLQLPPGITATAPGDAAERVSRLSRAYRVNLTVLALVALFTGAFLVFSVLSLSVAKRAQQFALLGVLGLTGRERLRLVLAESVLLGLAGSLLGIALGTALAALALRLLGGDLGGGYFSGVAPSLQWNGAAALTYGALGVLAAAVGGWWPGGGGPQQPPPPPPQGRGGPPGRRPGARGGGAPAAQTPPPPKTPPGGGARGGAGKGHWLSVALAAAGGLLALVPPLFGIPLAAYVSVGLLLVGGITALPWLIALLYDRLSPHVAHHLLPLLAVERARRVRESAAVAVSGVVASLSLAVALTVMVASFRESVTRWLDVVLPADLYVRTALGSSASDTAYFSPEFVEALGRLPGVARVGAARTVQLLLDPARPAVTLIARPLDDPASALPLVGRLLPVPPGHIGIYVSEPMVDLYGARPGTVFRPLSQSLGVTVAGTAAPPFYVAGVWRDYARQFGAIAMARADFESLSGDRRANDLALWLDGSAGDAQVQQSVRALAERQSGAGALLELASVSELRATSLRIFDRSFAVTYWLQAVAIAIGLFGVAASFSAQVLARRKEFGLLAHLGLTRRQILAVVAGEGAAWTLIGALAGLTLGLAVSTVLVYVVNPQSFHWTMDLMAPWLRLGLLCAAVVLAGTLTAWLAGRAAAGKDAVLAVKEDW
ncbi:ABC transporter permease [Polaromonas sp. CT11-55]|uniref:ABC transporter permease n=1 Tax=Polaromonas sp. CT11-55 TaxID=3243045 RepID=UPI0039A75DE1